MKKFLVSLICLFSFLIVGVKAVEMPEVTDREKINVYIFRGNGCSACYGALTTLNKNIGNYSEYLNIVTYEVWYNEANQALLQLVGQEFETEVSGIPFIVVGDSYTSIGFNEEEMLKAVAKEYENDDYKDVVKELAEEIENEESKTFEEACIEEEIIEAPLDEDTGSDALIIIGIFAVVVGGLVALVLFTRKK